MEAFENVKIPINDNNEGDSVGVTQHDVAGPSGADLPGGKVTPHQDAGAALDEANTERTAAGDVELQQQAGEVEQQTVDQNPTASNPDGGLPTENPVESESSGLMENHVGSNDAKKNSDELNSDEQISDEQNSDPLNSDATSNEIKDESEDELTKTKSQLLQLAADFENYKRQAARRESETRDRAVRGVLEDLLPVLDNFERAVSAAGSTSDVQSLRVGVEFILQQFQEALKNHGAEPIEAKGKKFDPARHDAIEEVESEEAAGTIIDDVQRGYNYKGHILRPSRVRVAK